MPLSHCCSRLICLCGPLRIFAFSALNGYFNAEAAEIRRERKDDLFNTVIMSNISLASCLLKINVCRSCWCNAGEPLFRTSKRRG
jgi:hypothetical protein